MRRDLNCLSLEMHCFYQFDAMAEYRFLKGLFSESTRNNKSLK